MVDSQPGKALLLEEIADRLAGEYTAEEFRDYKLSDDGRYLSKEVDLPERSLPLMRIRYKVTPHKLPIRSIADTLKIKPQIESVDVFFKDISMAAINYTPSDSGQELMISLYASPISRVINQRYEEIFRGLYDRLPPKLKGQAGIVRAHSQLVIYFTLPQSRLEDANNFLREYLNEVMKVK